MELKELDKFDTNCFGSGVTGATFSIFINSSDEFEALITGLTSTVLILDTKEFDLGGTCSGEANSWEVNLLLLDLDED